MTSTILRGAAIAIVALGNVTTLTAHAQEGETSQEPRRGETVTERQRPELDPLGVRAGAFLVFPKLGVSGAYDDNIFADESNTRDDFIATISPELAVRSDWNQHLLAFRARGDIGRYASNGNEDYEDLRLNANGRLDVLRGTFVSGGFAFNKLHEERSSPDDVNGINPTEYRQIIPTIGAFNRWNRFSLRGDFTANIQDYDDAQTSTGVNINNDDRDRTLYTVAVRGGYEIVPEYEAFVRLAWNTVKYKDGADDNGFNRDSDGYEAVVGTRIDFSGVTYGDIFAGWRRQTYDDSRLENAQGPTFGGSVTWNVTPLTTVKGGVTRSVEETTISTSSSYFKTEFVASVDHELLRNLLIGGTAGYGWNDFEGISREDNYYRAGAYARYLMHRNLYLTARYNYEQRDSNVTNADFDRNVVLFRIETQL